jgi:hypothetical protein
VSQYLIRHVIYDRKWRDEDVFLRILIFKFFNRVETWELLEGAGIRLTAAHINFKNLCEVLDDEMQSGRRIYSSAYIMPPSSNKRPPRFKHRSHLALIERMHRDRLVLRIRSCTTMQAAYQALREYPLMGPFLAYQLLTDLNYSDVTNFSEMEFTVPGPGARSGIRKCFPDLGHMTETDVIRYVTDRQELEFRSRGLDFITLGGRALQLVDLQNLFCEIDKYARVAHPDIEGLGKRTRIKRRFTPRPDAISGWYPPKWGVNERVAEQVRSMGTS